MADFQSRSILEIEGSSVWLEGSLGRNSYSKGTAGFHEEVENFFAILSPTKKEIEKRTQVFQRVEKVILQRWPTAKVETFGSFRFGLFLPTSDIDIRVLIGDGELDLPTQHKVLSVIQAALASQNLIVPSETKLLDGKLCEVAVLKVQDKISTVNVDIVAKKVRGPDAAALIQWWCDQWPMAPKLFLVLKQFIVFHNLDGVYRGGLNSYSLIIMIVCFLRMTGRIHHWNMDRFPINPRNVNLGLLLYQFLHYYGNIFDYQKYGLRVRDGGSFFQKQQTLGANVLTIEDPLEKAHNISGGTYGIENVKRAFGLAADVLRQPLKLFSRFFPDAGFLGRIVRVSPNTVACRKRILQDFTYAEIESILNTSTVPNWSRSAPINVSTRPSRSQVLQPISPRHNNMIVTKSRLADKCTNKHGRTDNDYEWVYMFPQRGF